MTANYYHVDLDQLDGHAGSLADLANQLSDVAARMPNALGDQPLGAFAQFLTAGLQTAMSEAASAIAHAAATTDEMSSGLSRTVQAYRLVEDQNAVAFSQEGAR
ncbi:hypothetical protein [Goodfellowiella coeruleoviolacea]|uniref:ESX-1 secretion-associated protein n=1 Tax=Goodfellowiella coeruleoviolacea TaxID=334858 RepID=A0AAE3G7P7_9PSEU|nr:hypothetical protein [Goodfellowiella coeruleoviolacea]MCP2163241.1 hypothetical protein [Goodfellowiella coeruleoviolacea]